MEFVTGAGAVFKAPITGRPVNAVTLGALVSGPLIRVAPLPMPRMKPSSLTVLKVTAPGVPTTIEPVNTALKLLTLLRPACSPLPCAMIVPVKLPLMSVVTSVNGRVSPPTVDPGIAVDDALKLIAGKFCVHTGVAVASVLNTPVPSAVKNRPKTVVVDTPCTGETQPTVEV